MRQDQRGKTEAAVAGLVVAGNNAADTESVVSKEDIHVHRCMVADHTYSEDKQTWNLLSICLNPLKR